MPGQHRHACLCMFGAALVQAALAPSAARACGTEAMPCTISGGHYYAALPDPAKGAPVMVFLHGTAGTGAKVMANGTLRDTVVGRGYALVAPSGQPFLGREAFLGWGFPDGETWPRDDIAFLHSVIADAADRFDLDADRLLLAGFSRGGSMVWDVACNAPDMARAYAAVAGAFWEPMPASCASPVHMSYAHGFGDRAIPLEGRVANFAGAVFEQGDVFESLRILAASMGCSRGATDRDSSGPVWSMSWTDCAGGSLSFALGPQGHSLPEGWAAAALSWFESLDSAP